MIANKTKIFSFVMSSALVFGLIGCSSTADKAQPSDNGQVTLRVAWWGSQERHNRTLEMIKLFEKKYPSIKVETEYTGFDDYWKKMATEAAGQNLPDVFQMDYSYLGDYAGRNQLAPLDSYASSGQLNLKDIAEGTLSSGRLSNQLYAIPLGINAPSVFYDPAMFQKAGVQVPAPGYTFDDLTNTLRELKAKVGTKDFYPLEANTIDFIYYLRLRGKSYYNKDGTSLGYDDDKYFVDYTHYRQMLEKEGLLAPTSVTKTLKGDQDSLLVKGQSAVRGQTSNLIIAFSKYANRPLGLLPPPTLPGGSEGNYLKPAMLISMSATSKHKDASIKFIDFFINDPEGNDALAAERGVPVSSKIRERLMPKLSPSEKEHFNYIDYVTNHSSPIDPPIPKGGREITALFDRLQDQITYGQITPEDAAKQFRSQANDILSRNKQ